MISLATPLDSFSVLLRRTYCWGRRVFWVGITLAAALVVLEAVHLAELLARVHPGLAWAVMLALVVPLVSWGGWRVLRYMRMPRVLVPPDLPEPAVGWTEAHRQRCLDFTERFLRRQSANPRLPSEIRETIPEVIVGIHIPLSAEDAADPVRAATALSARVQQALDGVLAPLDEEAKQLIRSAAVQVSLATAISPSVLMDGLITLVRNIDLISRLADLYYGRPGLLGTLRISRDVIGAAVAASALEMVGDNLSGALAEMTGSWGSRLIGPAGQGLVNGLVTMRIGAATRQRCRSVISSRVPWQIWRGSEYRRAVKRLYAWVTEAAGPAVTRPLSTWIGGAHAATRAKLRGGIDQVKSARNGWMDRLFRRADNSEPEMAAEDEEEEFESEPEPGRGYDPLLDSGLLD